MDFPDWDHHSLVLLSSLLRFIQVHLYEWYTDNCDSIDATYQEYFRIFHLARRELGLMKVCYTCQVTHCLAICTLGQSSA